jgi:hypothetical protein
MTVYVEYLFIDDEISDLHYHGCLLLTVHLHPSRCVQVTQLLTEYVASRNDLARHVTRLASPQELHDLFEKVQHLVISASSDACLNDVSCSHIIVEGQADNLELAFSLR